MNKTSGYSGTPLVQKLGIKSKARISFINAPDTFSSALGPLPSEIVQTSRGDVDFLIAFFRRRAELAKKFSALAARMENDGMLWIAWPKKTSGVDTDLNENIVREIGLAGGLVDVKVCAIDSIWSGLKFVRRLRDR